MSSKSDHKKMKQKLLSISRYLFDSRELATTEGNSGHQNWYGCGLDFLVALLGHHEIVRY
jgi:hypothetical protein